MRIISGKYKGKKLDGFDINGTRPTMDRVKESIFGSIQNYLEDAVVLDLFAGSGSLGLEAISNGSKEVFLVDNNNISIKTIQNNSLNMDDDIHIVHNDYQQFLTNIDKKFDLIFLDPPYDLNLINKALNIIKERNLLNVNGLVVCEYETEKLEPIYTIFKDKKYGKTKVTILKNNEGNYDKE